MRREVSAMEARQRLGELLDQVFYKEDQFVIKRGRKPMAAVIPMRAYEQFLRQRDEDFAVLDRIWSETADVSEEEADREIERAIADVRAEESAT